MKITPLAFLNDEERKNFLGVEENNEEVNLNLEQDLQEEVQDEESEIKKLKKFFENQDKEFLEYLENKVSKG